MTIAWERLPCKGKSSEAIAETSKGNSVLASNYYAQFHFEVNTPEDDGTDEAFVGFYRDSVGACHIDETAMFAIKGAEVLVSLEYGHGM